MSRDPQRAPRSNPSARVFTARMLTAVTVVFLLACACSGPAEVAQTDPADPVDTSDRGIDAETEVQSNTAHPKDPDAADPNEPDPDVSDVLAAGPMVALRLEDNPGVADEGQHWIGRNSMTDTSIELVWSAVDSETGPPRYFIHRIERSSSAFERRIMDATLLGMTLTQDGLVFDSEMVSNSENVFDSENESNSGASLVTTSTFTWTDQQVTTGQFYTYLLSVEVDGALLGRRWTNAVALTDTEPPSPITGLTAELAEASNETGVLLWWDPSTDNGAFSSYAVSLVTDSGKLQYLGGGNDAEQISFLDTRPPAGVVTYAVQAVDFHDNRTDATTITIDTRLSPAVSTEVTRRAEVEFVLDGDSFDMLFDNGVLSDRTDGLPTRRTVRLVGINAPEENECYAEASRALVRPFTLQELELQGDDVDGYGRLLAFAWDVRNGQVAPTESSTGPNVSGTINEWLVLEGAAVARSSFGHAWDDAFEAAEALAKQQQVGMWSPQECGSDAVARIQTVWFDAPGRDNENPNGEWVRIVNSGVEELDLTGWILRDESTRHRFSFPPGTRLAIEETVQVFSGCDSTSTDPAPTESPDGLALFWCDPDGPVWSNSGDTAFLLDADGNMVDTESWESVYDDE